MAQHIADHGPGHQSGEMRDMFSKYHITLIQSSLASHSWTGIFSEKKI